MHSVDVSLRPHQSVTLMPGPQAPGGTPGAVRPTGVPAELQPYFFDHPAMGTIWSLYLYASAAEVAETAAAMVFQEVDRTDSLLSNYRRTSELSRIGREAAEHAVTTDPETFGFLQKCFQWSAWSGGAFDITVGKLMKVWGFYRDQGRVPAPAELEQVRQEVGWERVQLDPARRTVRSLSPGIELDPGGIGKGHAVDRAVEVLREAHISAALLSAGSSTLYALGTPPGHSGWKVQVPAPGHADKTLSTVALRDTSLSTANYSEKNFTYEGRLYGSIMDPRTLRPVEGTAQVTAIAPSATDSDALSNVLFVVATEDRAAIMQRQPQASALVIAGDTAQERYELFRWPAPVLEMGRSNATTEK